jgi:hypothetical protein
MRLQVYLQKVDNFTMILLFIEKVLNYIKTKYKTFHRIKHQ